MITWTEKLAFVGMTREVTDSFLNVNQEYQYRVKVRIPGGLCSFGEGNTVEKAIASAAWGMNTDWNSVERKITERVWERISHL